MVCAAAPCFLALRRAALCSPPFSGSAKVFCRARPEVPLSGRGSQPAPHTQMEGVSSPKSALFSQVFHYLSLSILTIFLVEVGFKIFVYGREFFHHKFEVLDSIVVVVSFILDLVLLFREHEFEAVGLLILLRLWRVARIINGTWHRLGLLPFPELPCVFFPISKKEHRVLFSHQIKSCWCVTFARL